MPYTNSQMDQMLDILKPMLDHAGVMGYAAARNVRILTEELREYHAYRDALVVKYGEPNGDEKNGYTLRIDSPSFAAFVAELEPIAAMESNPSLTTLTTEQAASELGEDDIAAIWWMVRDCPPPIAKGEGTDK